MHLFDCYVIKDAERCLLRSLPKMSGHQVTFVVKARDHEAVIAALQRFTENARRAVMDSRQKLVSTVLSLPGFQLEKEIEMRVIVAAARVVGGTGVQMVVALPVSRQASECTSSLVIFLFGSQTGTLIQEYGEYS